jgi:hypothetical protein
MAATATLRNRTAAMTDKDACRAAGCRWRVPSWLLVLLVAVLPPVTAAAADVTDVAAAMVWGRVVERVLITLAGTGSLVLGFLLFRISVERGGEFSAGQKGAYVKLKDVGPGVFFALFGAIVLVASAWNPISIKRRLPHQPKVARA